MSKGSDKGASALSPFRRWSRNLLGFMHAMEVSETEYLERRVAALEAAERQRPKAPKAETDG